MKAHLIILRSLALFLSACAEIGISTEESSLNAKDTIKLVLNLRGRLVDTAYLNTRYKDPGADLFDNFQGNGLRCCEEGTVKVTGIVDTRFPGTNTLTYTGFDGSGNEAISITRTVNVVENKAGFLSGFYNVAMTCTAAIAGSSAFSITAGTYTASINPGDEDRRFEIISLNVGAEYVIPTTFLEGKIIYVDYWSPDYDYKSKAEGILAPSGNSFTITSTCYRYVPKITYTCKNVFTKRLILDSLSSSMPN